MSSMEALARRKRKPNDIHRLIHVARSSSSCQFTDEELDAPRPPSWAKGKAIGMFHKQKQDRLRRLGLAKPKKTKETPEFNIDLPPEKENYIRSILQRVSINAPPSITRIRSQVDSHSYEASRKKYSHVRESEFKRRFINSISSTIHGSLKGKLHYCDLQKDSDLDDHYRTQLHKKMCSPGFISMLKVRQKLPSFEKRDEIVRIVESNQVILIEGETGCGKTTQVPQFLLDSCILRGSGSTCRIICTQPRRISAISIAERVAEERNESLGDSVGYQIRLEKKLSRSTGSILFCTTGVILQWMQSKPLLNQVSHIILDEIHERDTTCDFLLALLKDIMPLRPDLKIILMSATLNAQQFSKYFFNCPTIHIPGFTYPVAEFYLEDALTLTEFKMQLPPVIKKVPKSQRKFFEEWENMVMPYIRNNSHKYSRSVLEAIQNPASEEISLELIIELISYICAHKPPGAILVFLPGWDKISSLNKMMINSGKFPSYQYLIIPLHSMLPTSVQRSIFDTPPTGVRKIVIATNIAETSITINDVVYVINSGKIKIKNFDIENNISTLNEEWVSLANSKQRKGRAGRVQDGECYHLYSRPRELLLESYQLPELLRTRLEEVILQAKILRLGRIGTFLCKVMDPPNPKAVELSLKLLVEMNALDEDEQLTPLGYHLAQLPVDPQAGKMILFAAMFGCINPITSIAASLSFKDAFVIPLSQAKEAAECKRRLSRGTKSDHMVMAYAMDDWQEASYYHQERRFAHENYLAHPTLELLRNMKKQFTQHLREMKFLKSSNVLEEYANVNSDNVALIKAIVCAGLYPNIAVIMSKPRLIKDRRVLTKIHTDEDGKVFLHPKSVNSDCTEYESPFLAYYLKLKSKCINLHDTTMVFPLALIFFAHSFKISRSLDLTVFEINKLIRFSCRNSTALLIEELRVWLDYLLEQKVSDPGVTDWSVDTDETHILRAIVELITLERNLYMPQVDDDEPEGDYQEEDSDDY